MADVVNLTDARAARFAAVQENERRSRDARTRFPAEFEAGDWSVAAGNGEAVVTVSTLPLRAEAVMYRIGSGVWTNAHLAAPGDFVIKGLTNGIGYAIQLRAFNATSGGDGSDVKEVTPTGA